MRFVAIIALSLGLVACQQKDTTADKEKAAENVVTKTEAKVDAAMAKAGIAADAVAGAKHVHKVACGCQLGGMCSNMIEVDGAYLPLRGEIGLGGMAFCGKKDLKAEVVGKIEGENFVATSFTLIEPPPAK